MGIEIDGPDHGLCEPVRRWVDSLRLHPPHPVRLHLAIGALPDGGMDERTPFSQPQLEIRSGPPRHDLTIRWLPLPALAVLDRRSRTASVTVPDAARYHVEALCESFLTVVLSLVVRRAGWHHVHAATAVSPSGTHYLLAGNAHAGKSTTAALMATRGWSVGGDDTTFLTDGGDRVEAVAARRALALRKGGSALLKLENAAAPEDQRGKRTFYPEDLGGRWVSRIAPGVILFPTVGDAASDTEPMSRTETTTELIRWSAFAFSDRDFAQDYLDLTARLSHQAQGYRLRLGRDLFDHPNRLAELIP